MLNSKNTGSTLNAVGQLNIMEKFGAYYGLQLSTCIKLAIIISTLSNVMNAVELSKSYLDKENLFTKLLEAYWQEDT